MQRKLVIDLLNAHLTENLDADENEMTLQTLAFVKSTKYCFENNNLPGHITGSAFILNKNENEALFTHHKKLNKWLQLGGHSDGNPDIYHTVLREAKEESGILSFHFKQKMIFDVDIHEIPASKKIEKHLHFDLRFLLIAESSNLIKSEESIDLKWIPLNEVNKFTNEKSIQRMVNKVIN